jgi:soluble lytic murein transglycosylase-like protein
MNEAWMRLSLLIVAALLPISLSAAPHPEASYYADAYARHYQVPRELVHAIIQQESNWNERAVSVKGACGLMQLMPRTASRLGVSDTFEMKQNISGGVRYLQYLLSQYHGDMRLAVAAYYAGEHRVHGLQYSNQQVIRYVEEVRRRYLKELTSHTSSEESQP